MRKNLKTMLKKGKVVVGATLSEWAVPSLVKVFANSGFDFLFIEYEHCLINPGNLGSVILTARDNNLPVIAKIPSLEKVWVTKLLDAGVTGIQLPPTNSRADIERLVELMKFPPLGKRPVAPGYGNTDYNDMNLPEFIKKGNDETILVAHIETKEGVDNIEDILECPHVDCAFIGQYDLSVSLGIPGQFHHKRLISAMEKILAAAQRRNISTGTGAASYDMLRPWIYKGMQLFESADEISLVAKSAKELIEQFRKSRIKGR